MKPNPSSQHTGSSLAKPSLSPIPRSLEQRLAARPRLRRRIEAILAVAERDATSGCTADEAEAHVREQVRALGQELLQGWAGEATEAATARVLAEQPQATRHGKKKLYWHSTYGRIEVNEPQVRVGRPGRLVRAFCQQAAVRPRGYSTLLQRTLTDFGAEDSFAKAVERVAEHYGVGVPVSSVRRITLAHGEAMAAAVPAARDGAADRLVTEMDGSMVPVVEDPLPESSGAAAATGSTDRRKRKRCGWREVRLGAAVRLGSLQTRYAATMGSVLEASLAWEAVARRAGLVAATRVHGVGDGAVWIGEQFDLRFGAQGRYLVDFYHVSEYLAAAAARCAPCGSRDWLHEQQGRLKANQVEAVLEAMAGRLEPAEKSSRRERRDEESPTPVRAAHQYLSDRRERLDYAGALAVGYPIGSGLIEGGHRHVVQARLKRSGMWWRAGNVRRMLGVRVVRANKDWEAYWAQLPARNN